MSEENGEVEFVALEQRCPRCVGQGKIPDIMERRGFYICPFCEGDGQRMTEFGESVLDFVRRRLKVTVDMNVSGGRG